MSQALLSRSPSLTITINHVGPMDLIELTTSLLALGNDFRYWADREGSHYGESMRLYIKEVRSGSVVVELVALASAVRPVLADVRTLAEFGQDLVRGFGYFRAGEGPRPESLDAKRADALAKVLAPVAQNPGNTLVISTGDGSPVTVNQLVIDSTQANAIQNRVREFQREEAAPVEGVQHQMLFYWFQARGGADGGGAGDRGIIEAIAPFPVKVRFANEEIKQSMLGEALFTKNYVVDVRVQTVKARISLYTILALHESFDRD